MVAVVLQTRQRRGRRRRRAPRRPGPARSTTPRCRSPSGWARAAPERLGGAAQLAGAAELIGIAPGARIGKTGDLRGPRRVPAPPAFLRGRPTGSRTARSTTRQARRAGDHRRPTTPPVIGEFLIDLPASSTRTVTSSGRTVRPAPHHCRSSRRCRSRTSCSTPCRQPARPPTCCFVIGLALIMFELFTAGVGVAGLVGAGCFVWRATAWPCCPSGPWASHCSCSRMFGFAVDVQTGVPRVWSVVGVVVARSSVRSSSTTGSACRGSPCSWASSAIVAVHGRRHARHGPHPVLHAHHRARVDDRRGGRGGHQRRPRRRGARAGRPVAGPHQPGHADRPARPASGSSRSTVCCSRSNRSRAVRSTTARSAGRRPTVPSWSMRRTAGPGASPTV